MELDEHKYQVNLKTLHILLVFSYINTGMFLLSELIGASMLPQMNDYYHSNTSLFPDEWSILMERMLGIPQWYFLLLAVLDIASIAGMVLMWRLRKNGFHCYALSKLLLMLMPLLFLDRSFVGIGNIMIGILFIAYYYFLLKGLSSYTPADGSTPEPSDNSTSEA